MKKIFNYIKLATYGKYLKFKIEYALKKASYNSGRGESISVIIPTYEENEYLYYAVYSCLVQKGNLDIEVLICVNGYKENWFEKIKRKYKNNSQVKVLWTKVFGSSAGRNIGLKNASKDWITFLDDDDYFSVNYLKEMVDGIKKDVDVVVGPIFNITQKFSTLKKETMHTKIIRKMTGVYPLNEKMVRNFFTVTFKLIKRKTVERKFICFDEKINSGADMNFWFDNMKNIEGKISYIPVLKDAYIRRILRDSLSRKYSSSKLKKIRNLEKRKAIFNFQIIRRIDMIENFLNKYFQNESMKNSMYRKFLWLCVEDFYIPMRKSFMHADTGEKKYIKEKISEKKCLYTGGIIEVLEDGRWEEWIKKIIA
ncbi:MAG: glycosyltransferase [Clostridiales Family XIII bacterium]|jgi:glycosyltransferase involved in cell wall biosynthesis|nr:glycosyltransferase [Clostridiales Family XIII bacterium]